jgi:hypothetical protein
MGPPLIWLNKHGFISSRAAPFCRFPPIKVKSARSSKESFHHRMLRLRSAERQLQAGMGSSAERDGL